jgi:hypothetical protein
MIALALGLISLVVMIATGVAASSTGGDHLAFLGVGVETTTAQVFLTGAIFGWVFVIALWLLRLGMHRSGERCAQLAARRSRRAGRWLGFGDAEADDAGWGGWQGWDEWGDLGRPSGKTGRRVRGVRFRAGLADRIGGAGAAGDGRGTPWRADGRLDDADRAVARAADQPGLVPGGHPPSPVTRGLPGLGMDGGAQHRQIGGGPGAMPGEDRGADGEQRQGENRQ